MGNRNTSICVAALLIIILMSVSVTAQITSNVVNSKVGQAKENERLAFTLDLYQSNTVSRVLLAYKTFNATEYRKLEMNLTANKATIQLQADEVLPPSIDYYFVIEYSSGEVETYPIGYPERGNPLSVTVETLSEKDEEIVLLSPEKDELAVQDQFFIAISLLRAPDKVNRASAKIYLDGKDITQLASFTEDLIMVDAQSLEGLSLGEHDLKIEIKDNENKTYYSTSRSFSCVTESYAMEAGKKLNYHADLQSESRNERMNKVSSWYNNLSVNANATYGSWALNGTAYLTSEEKKYLQPNNRFFVSLESDWLKLGFGDSYPDMPNLILNGKRVRGLSASLNYGVFGLQAAFGEVTRGLSGKLVETYSSTTKPSSYDVVAIDSARYGNPYGRIEYGTYKRNIVAVHPSLTFGDNFQFGLSYLHGKDDTKSIEFGKKPMENLVLGSDMQIGFDEKRVLLTAQGAFSIQNTDISSGTLSDEDIDSTFKKGGVINVDPEQIKRLKNIAGQFFTINENIVPLNPEKFATAAAEAAFSLNYFGNFMKATYLYRGNDHQSFGQSYIRTDVAGFNFIDRIRLFSNSVSLSLGYEKLSDNLQKTKKTTIDYQTLNISGSYFPSRSLPSVTLGFSQYSTDNNLAETANLADTANQVVNDVTNRFSVQLGYDLVYKVKHRTSLSVSNSGRNDFTYRNSDATNTSVNAAVNSQWLENMNSYLNMGLNRSRVSGREVNYFSLSLGGSYTILNDKLELSSYLTTSFGDYKQKAFDFNAQYFIIENFSIQMQLRYVNYSNSINNSIFGLMSRYAF